MVVKAFNEYLEERRKKKAARIVEGGMLDSYRESEEVRKAEQLKKEADRLIHLKQYGAAIEEYKRALDSYPLKESEKLFQKAADFLFTLNYSIGTAYAKLHEYKIALDYFDRSLKIEEAADENKIKAHASKGNCYYQAKKFIDRVKERHSKQIMDVAQFQTEEKIAEQMRRLDEKENLFKQALACYTAAADLDRHNAEMWYRKGQMELQLGMAKEAIHSFDNVLNIQEGFENQEKIELFDEMKREKGLEIMEKRERAYKTKTGHLVKNKGEMLIANFLFDKNLLFQYNQAATWADIDFHSNFYIPQLELYIEHFKHDQDKMHLKIDEYKRHKKQHIHTTAEDEVNMEEILAIKLKPYISL